MSNETQKCNDQPASERSCPDPAGSMADEQERLFERMKNNAGSGYQPEVLKWVHWSKDRPDAMITILVSLVEDEEVPPAYYMGEGKWRHADHDHIVWDDSEIIAWADWPAGPRITQHSRQSNTKDSHDD